MVVHQILVCFSQIHTTENTEQDFFQILGNFSEKILKYCAFLPNMTVANQLEALKAPSMACILEGSIKIIKLRHSLGLYIAGLTFRIQLHICHLYGLIMMMAC